MGPIRENGREACPTRFVSKWLKSSVERLSGNSEWAPFCAPEGLSNGAKRRRSSTSCATKTGPAHPSGEFPDSLWKCNSAKFTTKPPKITHLGDALGIIECDSYLVTSLARKARR
jgi:hypothetical protein